MGDDRLRKREFVVVRDRERRFELVDRACPRLIDLSLAREAVAALTISNDD